MNETTWHNPDDRARLADRDRDWVLAIGHALGLDSGYEVPIVPEVEPFKRLFASLTSARLAEAEQEYQDARVVREQLEARLAEAERSRDSWKREAEMNADFGDELHIALETLKAHSIHVTEKWCWCGPTIENHSDDGFTVAVLTGPRPYQKPEMMGTITEYPTDSAPAVEPCKWCGRPVTEQTDRPADYCVHDGITFSAPLTR